MRCLSVLPLVLALAACSGGASVQDAEKSAQINAELGVRYMVQGQNKLAMEKLERALGYDPDNPLAHHYLGELYRRLERPVAAGEHYRKAIDKMPNDPALNNNYGVFLCEQGRVDEAKVHFMRVLDDPVYQAPGRVYENLGLCARRKGDLAEAEQWFRKALSIDPRLAAALLAMAEVSFEADNALSARGYLQRYEEVARHTPGSLWLGVRAERRLGDEARAQVYGRQLASRFPDAEQTKLYLRSLTP